MRTCRWLLALGGLLLCAAERLHAQGMLWAGPYGFGYSRGGRHFRLSVGFLDAPAPSPYALLPCGCPPFGPIGVLSVTTVAPPPIVVVPRPVIVEVPPPPVLPPLPVPERDEVPPVPPPPPPPRKEEPARPPRKENPDLPRPPAPADDPREEHSRQLLEAHEAFAAREYGRAAQHFRRAIRLDPRPALPWLELAQALVAQGKYHEAVDSILEGMARRPDWPSSPFRPLDLYGENVLEYRDHLRALELAGLRHPADPPLLFLTGYQLWFDGRSDEAGRLFGRALAAGDEPLRRAALAFLRALPAGEAL